MPIQLVILLIAGMIVLVRSTLFWFYFLQIKQYRPDRIGDEIKSKKFFLVIFSIHRILLIILYGAGWIIFARVADLSFADQPGAARLEIVWFWISASYIWGYAAYTIFLALTHSLRLPRFTKKIVTLFVLIFIPELIFIYFTFPPTFGIILFEVLQSVIVL